MSAIERRRVDVWWHLHSVVAAVFQPREYDDLHITWGTTGVPREWRWVGTKRGHATARAIVKRGLWPPQFYILLILVL